MLDYSSLRDGELCALARQSDSFAEEEILKRYVRLVRSVTRPLFLAGGDNEDLLQEGLMGFISAVRSFDGSYGVPFVSYAETCIRNRLKSVISSSLRYKNSVLNGAVPIDVLDESVVSDSSVLNPEDLLLYKEILNHFLDSSSGFLSKFETLVAALFLEGYSYSEIAEKLGKSLKSVDNAIQRIRRKMADYLMT